eukprot:gene6952-3969_t
MSTNLVFNRRNGMANLRLPALLAACLCLWATAQASRLLDHEELSELSMEHLIAGRGLLLDESTESLIEHSRTEEAMATGGTRSLLLSLPTVTAISPIVQPMHLLGGDTLTITGTLFVTGATVKVGNTNCVATFVNAASITCIAPAMPAGEYAISVTNPDTGRSIAITVVVRYAAYLGTPPNVTSVSPIIQPRHLLGGDTLTITGTAFVAGATVSIGGNTCTNVVVASSTITCVAPPASAATTSAAVVVTNPDTGYNVATSIVVTYAAYTGTDATRPTVTSTNPTYFPPLDGDTLAITGTMFGSVTGLSTGHKVSIGGTTCTAVNAISATSITCIAPDLTAGSYPVVVTNPDTGYNTAMTVKVQYQSANEKPIVSSVSPNTQTLRGNSSLTITGSKFLDNEGGATVTIGGVACANVVVVSDTSIQCYAPAMGVGPQPVMVTIPDKGYSVNSPAVPVTYAAVVGGGAAPVVSSVTPSTLALVTGSSRSIAIAGTFTTTGTTVTIGGTLCTIATIAVGSITCTAPSKTAGIYDVLVIHSDGVYNVNNVLISYQGTAFTAGVGNVPSVTGVTTTKVGATTTSANYLRGGDRIVIAGTNFVVPASGAVTDHIVTVGGLACTSVTVTSTMSLSCLAPAVSAATVSAKVVVTVPSTGYSTSADVLVTYAAQESTPPTLDATTPFTPATFRPEVGGQLTIAGTGFGSVGTTVTVGGVACTTPTITATQIVCTAPSSLKAGKYTVVVVNSDGGAVSSSVTYQGTTPNLLPTVTSVSTTVTTTPGTTAVAPNYLGAEIVAGANKGAGVLTIAGTLFGTISANSATVTVGGKACTSPVVTTDNIALTCNLPAMPTSATSHVVVVTVPSVGYSTGSGFTVTYPARGAAMVITSYTPTTDVAAGGAVITLTGTGFDTASASGRMQVTIGGLVCSAYTTSYTATTSEYKCSAPSNVGGNNYPLVIKNTNDGGTALAPVNFTYQGTTPNLLPTVTSVSTTVTTTPGTTAVAPNYLGAEIVAGNNVGAGVLTIAGTFFGAASTDLATVTVGGQACTSVDITTDNIALTCNLPAMPTSATSHVVVVTVPSVGYSIGSGFTVTYPARGTNAPTLATFTPATFQPSTGGQLTIGGTGFVGTTVTVGSVACTTPTITNSAQIVCTAPSSLKAGKYTVVVVNSDGGTVSSSVGAVTYQGTTPTVTSVSTTVTTTPGTTAVAPNYLGAEIVAGNNVGAGVLTIAGTFFGAASTDLATVTVGGQACTSVDITTDNIALTCNLPAMPTSATSHVVVVTVPSVGYSIGSGFTVTYPARGTNAPTLATFTPATFQPSTGGQLTIGGTGFVGTTVTVGGVACTTPTITNSADQIVCTAPSSLKAGKYTVVVVNSDGGTVSSSVGAVTYQGTTPNLLPTVTSASTTVTTTPGSTAVAPNYLGAEIVAGNNVGAGVLTIAGTFFGAASTDLATVTVGGQACTSVDITTDNIALTCNLPAMPTSATSHVVVVTVPSVGYSIGSGFTVTYPARGTNAPTLATFTPATFQPSTGGQLTIGGTGFVGTTVTVGGVACTTPTITNSADQIVCTAPSSLKAGKYTVVVVNSDGGTVSSSVGAVTYQGTTPTVTSVSTTVTTTPGTTAVAPNYLGAEIVAGNNVGAGVLTIAGTFFGAASTDLATVTVGGQACTSVDITTDNIALTCNLPAMPTSATSHVVVVTVPSVGYSTGSGFTVTYPARGTAPALAATPFTPATFQPSTGGQLTIAGTGFVGTTVTVGGVACTTPTITNSADQIVCTAPSSLKAGKYTVVVVNSDGGTVSSSVGAVTYQGAYRPTITSVTTTKLGATTTSANFLRGGDVLTIVGTDFDVTPGNNKVTVGDNACIITGGGSLTTPLICTLPAVSTATPSAAVVVANTVGFSTESYSVAYVAYTGTGVPPTVTSVYPTNFEPLDGDILKITGTLFSTTSTVTVTVGGVGCTGVTVATGGLSLTCTAPNLAAGSYPVVVINPDNFYSTKVFSVTYQSGTMFNAYNNDGATTVTVEDVPCTAVSVVSDNTMTCVAPAMTTAGNKKVVVTIPDIGYSTSTVLATYAAAPASPPTVTAVSPVVQANFLAGGETLAITGSLFVATPTVSIGGTACTPVTFITASSISCTSPPKAGGKYSVVVTNPDTGYSTATNVVVAYQSATPPVLTSVTRSVQTLAGTDTITLVGTGFLTGATISVGGTPCTPVTFGSALGLSCIAPAKPAGIYAVVVTNPSTNAGYSIAVDKTVTYQSGTPPVVTAVSPVFQPKHLAGGDTLTITGSSFSAGAALSVQVGSMPCSTVTHVSNTSISCVAPAMAAGNYPIVVTNPDTGYSLASNVTVEYADFTGIPPTVTSVSPVIQPKHILGGDTLTIMGTLFATGATVTVGGTMCTQVTIVSSTSITCIAPAKPAGEYAVVVTNSDTGVSTSVKVIYMVYTGVPPTATAVSPIIQTRFLVGGDNLTITGTLFLAAATVQVGDTSCTNVTVVSATTINCFAPAKPAGSYAVVVTNNDTGYSNATTVVVTYVPENPTVTAVSPIVLANLSGGINLTITGSGFVSGSTITVGGTACINVTYVSGTALTCLAPAKSGGTYPVVVSNPDTGVTNATTVVVTYNSGFPPVVTAVSPIIQTKFLAGGDNLTITGTTFATGANVSIGGIACTSITFGSATTLYCVAPAKPAGSYVIVVTNNDTGYSTATNVVVTYVPQNPTVTAVSPIVLANLSGGDNLTITGTGFVTNTSVTIGGTPCMNVMMVSSNSLNCIAPAKPGGSYAVVVTNPDTGFSNGTTVLVKYPSGILPVVTSVSPVVQARYLAGGDILTITGTLFSDGATISIGGTACTSVSFVSNMTLTCMAPAKAEGSYPVVVTNPDSGRSNATAVVVTYQMRAIMPSPTVTFVTPVIQTKFLAGGDILTITGTGFVNGAVVIIEADGFVEMALKAIGNTSTAVDSVTEALDVDNATLCTNVTVVSNTTITCTAPAKFGGTYPVVVINPDLGYSISTKVVIIYQSGTPPIVTAVSPIIQANNLSGGNNLTITGSAFVNGATVNVGDIACTKVTFVSATSLNCIAPAMPGGMYPIEVTNPDSGFSVATNVVVMYNSGSPPIITSVSPVNQTKNLLGGDTLTIRGSMFVSGAIEVNIGDTACPTPKFVNTTTVTCVAPAMPAGTYAVTVINLDGGYSVAETVVVTYVS